MLEEISIFHLVRDCCSCPFQQLSSVRLPCRRSVWAPSRPWTGCSRRRWRCGACSRGPNRRRWRGSSESTLLLGAEFKFISFSLLLPCTASESARCRSSQRRWQRAGRRWGRRTPSWSSTAAISASSWGLTSDRAISWSSSQRWVLPALLLLPSHTAREGDTGLIWDPCRNYSSL